MGITEQLMEQLKAVEASLRALDANFNADRKKAILLQLAAITVDVAMLEYATETAVQPWPDEPTQKPVPMLEPITAPVLAAINPQVMVNPEPLQPEETKQAPDRVPPPITLNEVSKIEPLLAPKTGSTLQEAAAQKQQAGSINDKLIQTRDKNLGDKLKGKPIQNLVTGIPLNDRVLIIRSLFKGDHAGFENTIRQLDTFTNKADALQYVQDILIPAYHWDIQDEIFNSLIVLIERRYMA